MVSSTDQDQQKDSLWGFSYIRLLRLFFITNFITTSWFLYQLIIVGQPSEASEFYRLWIIAFGIGILLEIVLLVLIVLTWTRFGEVLTIGLLRIMNRVSHYRWLVWFWFIFSSLAYGWLVLGPYGFLFNSLGIRICLLWPLVGISSILFQSIWFKRRFWVVFSAAAVWYSAIYLILTFLPGISTYPFTLTWSEGTAYYSASLFFSEKIYGIKTSLPLINPSRHMLLAIPFLLNGLPIWVHRLWEVLLWLIVSGITITLIVRRLEIHDSLIRWIFFAWVFIYLFQGPVYYFLLISLIPVLWGFDAKRFKKTLLLVLIGSAWAGVSRVNWVPVPALLAAVLYFLEQEFDHRTWLHYLLKPAIWVAAGTITALLVWYGYASFSGTPIEHFGIYFTSNMLWYRLFPNATFKSGVLLAALIASIPLLGYIAMQLYKSGSSFHPIRRIGIGLILLVLFIGGLIVSTKIGGGNNIHNLDSYMFILFVTGSYIYFNKTLPDYVIAERDTSSKISYGFIALAILIPIVFVLQQGKPVDIPKPEKIENALLKVREYAGKITNEGGKVLFIGERQLLTFNQVAGVPLIPDYERMTLMEMVMGSNEAYLNEFYQRIANQEFALIVSEPLSIRYKGRSEHFGEENDVYVRWVTIPVLCYYEPVKTISKFPIQLLMPRTEPDDCPYQN